MKKVKEYYLCLDYSLLVVLMVQDDRLLSNVQIKAKNEIIMKIIVIIYILLLKIEEQFFVNDFAYMVKEHLNRMDRFHFQCFQLI